MASEGLDSYGDLSAEHDSVWSGPSKSNYAICSIARSGSSLLSRLLWDTNVGGKPIEYFHPGHAQTLMRRWGTWGPLARFYRLGRRRLRPPHPLGTLATKLYARDLQRHRTSSNGVFGFKLHFHQYEKQLGLVPLDQFFPSLVYLSITRRDRVAQAASWWRAGQTGQWAAGDVKQREAHYSFQGILKFHFEILREEAAWDELFLARGIQPLRFVYEDMLAGREAAVSSALRQLGVTERVAVPEPRMKQQVDATTQSWIDQYLEALSKRGLSRSVEVVELLPHVSGG